jgi:hypothetical protein
MAAEHVAVKTWQQKLSPFVKQPKVGRGREDERMRG